MTGSDDMRTRRQGTLHGSIPMRGFAQSILELIAANTWPERWICREIRGDVLVPQVIADGIMQHLLEEGHQ